MTISGFPDITPEMQDQVESMMKDPQVMKKMTSMMRNMDPETIKQLGLNQPFSDEKIDTLKMPSSTKASKAPVEMITPRFVSQHCSIQQCRSYI